MTFLATGLELSDELVHHHRLNHEHEGGHYAHVTIENHLGREGTGDKEPPSCSNDRRHTFAKPTASSARKSSIEIRDESGQQSVLVRKPIPETYDRQYQSAENRVLALESLTLITTLLFGMAIHEGLQFKALIDRWTHPRLEIYCFLLFFALMCNLFISTMALIIIVACKRVSSWDFAFEGIDNPGNIFDHSDYVYPMRILYGDASGNWLVKDDQAANERVLRLPLQYWMVKKFLDGSLSPAGIGITLFPYSIVAQALAVGLDYTKDAHRTIHIIVFSIMMPFLICTFVPVRNLVKIVLH